MVEMAHQLPIEQAIHFVPIILGKQFILCQIWIHPFMVEMAQHSPIGQAIHFVPNLAKLSAECTING